MTNQISLATKQYFYWFFNPTVPGKELICGTLIKIESLLVA